MGSKCMSDGNKIPMRSHPLNATDRTGNLLNYIVLMGNMIHGYTTCVLHFR